MAGSDFEPQRHREHREETPKRQAIRIVCDLCYIRLRFLCVLCGSVVQNSAEHPCIVGCSLQPKQGLSVYGQSLSALGISFAPYEKFAEILLDRGKVYCTMAL